MYTYQALGLQLHLSGQCTIFVCFFNKGKRCGHIDIYGLVSVSISMNHRHTDSKRAGRVTWWVNWSEYY